MEFLQSIAEAISLYRYIFWPLVGLMVLIIIFIRWWDQVSYFFLNLMSSLPLFGYITRLSRSHEPRRRGTGAWPGIRQKRRSAPSTGSITKPPIWMLTSICAASTT